MTKMTKIAILCVQGSFFEHAKSLKTAYADSLDIIYLRNKADFVPEIDGIIIPGGESTVMRCLTIKHGLWDILWNWVQSGKPVWGTCAGIILLSAEIKGCCNEHTFGGLSIVVDRNAYGSQINSFVSEIKSKHIENSKGIFIRAPIIRNAISQDVQILGTIGEDQIVAVKQGYLLGTTFHPELSDDLRWHQYFIKMVQEKSLMNE